MLGFRQTLRLEQELDLKQMQAELQKQEFSLRLKLIQALHEEDYEPTACCPHCQKPLTCQQIISGFNTDPNDFNSRCPYCHNKFLPQLICLGKASRLELPFYCKVQALARLPETATRLRPEQFAREYPAVYRSLLIHCGSIGEALKQQGMLYPFEESNDWKTKLLPYLGRLPDTVIARCVNVFPRVISALRKKLNIAAYNRKQELEILESLAEK